MSCMLGLELVMRMLRGVAVIESVKSVIEMSWK
jgi:hypothetical protein